MAGARAMAEERGVPQERIAEVGAELRERGLVADVDGAVVETPAGRALIDQLLAAVREELAQRITRGRRAGPRSTSCCAGSRASSSASGRARCPARGLGGRG